MNKIFLNCLILTTYSMLYYASPSLAATGQRMHAADLRPMKATVSQQQFESYVSNDCERVDSGKQYIISGNSLASLNLNCKNGSALANWKFDNKVIGVGIASGGYMQSTAQCCKIKTRPITSALAKS